MKRHFFYGTMKSSKSAQLMIQAFNLEAQGKEVVVFKSSLDTRGNGVIESRAMGQQREAILVQPTDVNVMYEYVNTHPRIDFVFVDEVQFLSPRQVDELARISVEFNVPIFAYGLLLTYFGELFESSKRLIEKGFQLQELKIQCDYCTNKATHHLLLQNGEVVRDTTEVVIGDSEYKIVCYPCFHHKYEKE